MSNRQLEEKREEAHERKVAKLVGLSVGDLGSTDWYIDTLEGRDGQLNSYLIIFRDESPQHILCKIKDLDENNTVWLNPWAFDEPEN